MGSLRLDKAPDYARPRNSHAAASLRTARWRGSQVVLVTALLIGSVLFLYPFVWMVSTSVKDNIEVYSAPLALLPQQWRFDNYVTAFTLVPFGRFYLNTVIMTLGRVVGQLFLASMAAASSRS